jgi:glycosyltransferase involved in cell wall biosynthesis
MRLPNTPSLRAATGRDDTPEPAPTPEAGTRGGATGGTGRSGPLLSFFIPDLTVGGAEQVLLNIVNGLSARGYDLDLLLSRRGGKLEPRLADRVDVVELPPSRTPVLGVASHLPALAGYLRRENPAVLFPHLTQTSVVCLTAKRLLDTDTRVIPTHHAAFGTARQPSLKDRLVRRLITRLYPSADHIVAVSEGVADSVVERVSVDRDDLSVLYNPIDVDAVRARARDPVDHEWVEDSDTDVVLFVGRVAEQKDLETWLRTFQRVHERRPDTRGIIVGQGPQRARLSDLAASLGLADVVSLPGYVENPYRYMGQASVFLLSSLAEGLPTVLVEALACGCPVVSTDCPSGPREILDGGEYGRLAPVGDVDALATAVTASLSNPTGAERRRRRAGDFAPESVLDDYEQFIREHAPTSPARSER